LPSKLESIKRALLLLGLRPVRNWASMIVLSGFDDKPQELIITAMLRARFCEQLAQSYGHKAADAYFTVGLLSTLDAFLNSPMAEALESIPLTDEVKSALLDRTGDLGEVLQMVLNYERGIVKQRPAAKPLAAPIADVFLDAVAWVTEAAAELIMCNTARQAA
jgi:EAL and modified HD-GYP domain-containing signal transduction protein